MNPKEITKASVRNLFSDIEWSDSEIHQTKKLHRNNSNMRNNNVFKGKNNHYNVIMLTQDKGTRKKVSRISQEYFLGI